METEGKLAQAAAELTAPASKHYMNGKIVLTANFVFCKGTGFVFSYDEIVWAYKHRQTTSFLLIPIKVTESLYLATRTMKPRLVVAMGKDKNDEIKNSIIEIYNHNNQCLIGYTQEVCARYKQLQNN